MVFCNIKKLISVKEELKRLRPPILQDENICHSYTVLSSKVRILRLKLKMKEKIALSV